MRIILWFLVVLGTTALVGCGNLSYRLDSGQNQTDPVLIAPGTKGTTGGPIWLSLPEFSLDSRNPLQLNICLPDLGCVADTKCNNNSKCVTFTLKNTIRGLEVSIPRSTYDALARTPHPEEVLFKALKREDKKFRILRGPNTLATKALAVSLATRLPRSTSNTWSDLYAYDATLRSLALVPGMRLRLEGMLPVTADLERLSNERSQGSINAPSYLYLSPTDDGTSASITLSPALRRLGVNDSSECSYDCPRWTDAGGLSSLIGREWRYWSIIYPQKLGPVRGVDGPLQFVNEELLPTAGPPAVLLIATRNGADMAAFIEKAKERQRNTNLHESIQIQTAQAKWRGARQTLDAKAKAAGLSIEALILVASNSNGLVTKTEEVSAAIKALQEERAAYDFLIHMADDVSIDCTLNTPPVAGCYVLRYRVLPVPEVLVTVQGVQRWIEVGTTVGMVLAPHEPIRAARTLDGEYDNNVELWRNASALVDVRGLNIHRFYRGVRHAIEVTPDSPADAISIRNVILQAGDEIKWSN